MNKKLISNIICLIASGVCFFFVITGINISVYEFSKYNEISETISKYEKSLSSSSSSSSYGSSSMEKYLEKYKSQAGIYLRNAFTGLLLSAASVCGIVLAARQFLGKRIFNIFGWVAAGVTTATALAYLITAIVAIADKEIYSFSLLPTDEKSPFNAFLIIYSIFYLLVLGAQFLAIFFSKDDNAGPAIAATPVETPSFAAPTAAPAAPVAPVAAPAPEAPVAPAVPAPAPVAPAAPVETLSADQGAPTAA